MDAPRKRKTTLREGQRAAKRQRQTNTGNAITQTTETSGSQDKEPSPSPVVFSREVSEERELETKATNCMRRFSVAPIPCSLSTQSLVPLSSTSRTLKDSFAFGVTTTTASLPSGFFRNSLSKDVYEFLLTHQDVVDVVETVVTYYNDHPDSYIPSEAQINSALQRIDDERREQSRSQSPDSSEPEASTLKTPKVIIPAVQASQSSKKSSSQSTTSTPARSNNLPSNTAVVSAPDINSAPPTTPSSQRGWAAYFDPRSILSTPLNFFTRRRAAQPATEARPNKRSTLETPSTRQQEAPHVPATISHPTRKQGDKNSQRSSGSQDSTFVPSGLAADIKLNSSTTTRYPGRFPDSHLPIQLRGLTYEELPEVWQKVSQHMRKDKPNTTSSKQRAAQLKHQPNSQQTPKTAPQQRVTAEIVEASVPYTQVRQSKRQQQATDNSGNQKDSRTISTVKDGSTLGSHSTKSKRDRSVRSKKMPAPGEADQPPSMDRDATPRSVGLLKSAEPPADLSLTERKKWFQEMKAYETYYNNHPNAKVRAVGPTVGEKRKRVTVRQEKTYVANVAEGTFAFPVDIWESSDEEEVEIEVVISDSEDEEVDDERELLAPDSPSNEHIIKKGIQKKRQLKKPNREPQVAASAKSSSFKADFSCDFGHSDSESDEELDQRPAKRARVEDASEDDDCATPGATLAQKSTTTTHAVGETYDDVSDEEEWDIDDQSPEMSQAWSLKSTKPWMSMIVDIRQNAIDDQDAAERITSFKKWWKAKMRYEKKYNNIAFKEMQAKGFNIELVPKGSWSAVAFKERYFDSEQWPTPIPKHYEELHPFSLHPPKPEVPAPMHKSVTWEQSQRQLTPDEFGDPHRARPYTGTMLASTPSMQRSIDQRLAEYNGAVGDAATNIFEDAQLEKARQEALRHRPKKPSNLSSFKTMSPLQPISGNAMAAHYNDITTDPAVIAAVDALDVDEFLVEWDVSSEISRDSVERAVCAA